MIRYLRYAFLAILGIALIVMASANRGSVTLSLLPDEMAGFLGYSWRVTLPLFLVILASILAGVLIGFVWEWFREHKHRAEASRKRREAEALKREVSRLKTPDTGGKGDDVMALIEGSGARS